MRDKIVANVLGAPGYTAFEATNTDDPVKDFEHPDIPGTWRVFTDGKKYLLFRDEGRYMYFREFVPTNDNVVYLMTREWRRRPKSDNIYNLYGPPTRVFSRTVPTTVGQSLHKFKVKP